MPSNILGLAMKFFLKIGNLSTLVFQADTAKLVFIRVGVATLQSKTSLFRKNVTILHSNNSLVRDGVIALQSNWKYSTE